VKNFLFWFYTGLYLFVVVSLLTVEFASVKVGWPWIKTLVVPMGWLFLVVNVPLALIAVVKIGHVVFLHSVQHHRNVMRSIREADRMSPSPVKVTPSQIMLEEDDLSQQSQSGVPMLSGVPLSQSVPRGTASTIDDFNVTVDMYLSKYPQASIREVERATRIPKSTIGRTKAWQNRPR
jgi:uncharacterized membrane-anchored protein YitT (DUF2179 family)